MMSIRYDVMFHYEITVQCHYTMKSLYYDIKVSSFGHATVLRVFTSLIKPIYFLCCHKGFCIIIYLDDILVLVCCSTHTSKGMIFFFCSVLVHPGLHICCI